MIISAKKIRISLNIIIMSIAVAVLSNCNSSTKQYSLDTDQSDEGARTVVDHSSDGSYPIPSETSPTEPYPIPTISSSASQEIEAYLAPATATGALLALNKPITLDDVIVTGVGPPGLQIYILNITFMGDVLGSGVIEQDGTYAIAISDVSVGSRIGLTADITTIGLQEDDIQPGENAILVPQVGYFYDSFVIRE